MVRLIEAFSPLLFFALVKSQTSSFFLSRVDAREFGAAIFYTLDLYKTKVGNNYYDKKVKRTHWLQLLATDPVLGRLSPIQNLPSYHYVEGNY